MTDAILTLNAGSSSLKFGLFAVEATGLKLLSRGQIEGIGVAPHLLARDAAGAIAGEHRWSDANLRHEAFLETLFDFVDGRLDGRELAAIGHRVVHGGAAFDRPMLVNPTILATLDGLCPLAPLHQPHNLAAIGAAQAMRPGLPQAACFDTAFHHDHAEVVTRFALPRAWHDQGVRRYGFHGLSYEFVSGELRKLDPDLASGRVIVAHLGAGASLCAINNGRSVDTTMGFTALDGLMMGTRAGALDPGVILYMQEQAGMTPAAVSAVLYEQSGLLGVSGVSSDMRELLASSDPAAAEAIDLFVFRIVREIGALTASMGGLDGVVFTAGIGENAPQIRAKVANGLAWAGLELDEAANTNGCGLISGSESLLKAWVIPTNEEAMIAQWTAHLIAAASSTPAGL